MGTHVITQGPPSSKHMHQPTQACSNAGALDEPLGNFSRRLEGISLQGLTASLLRSGGTCWVPPPCELCGPPRQGTRLIFDQPILASFHSQ